MAQKTYWGLGHIPLLPEAADDTPNSHPSPAPEFDI
jgi:hypothetical protein